MTRNAVLRRAVRYALRFDAVAVWIAIPAIAHAADQGPPAARSEQAERGQTLPEIVITGSRIPEEPSLAAISPVTSVSQDAIKSQGVTRIEDLLNNLPQVMADQGAMTSNGATGTAAVNLRGIGPQYTLVLINGRRLMPGAPGIPPDLNNIPASLVERVDVLTGGASAVYGADAVAGVVNFVMNDRFQGFRIDANADMNNHQQHNYYGQFAPAAGDGSAPSRVNDGKTKDITFILGGNFADGKGNVTTYLGYRRIDALLQSQRDFSRCTLDTIGTPPAVICSGSSTSATGGFISANFLPPPNNSVPNFVFLAPPFGAGGATVNPSTGQFVPFTTADAFNFGALNYYQRPDERWTGGAFAHYDWDAHHQIYTEFMFMSDHTVAQIAPSGAFLGSGTGLNPTTGNPDGAWAVNCNNPFLSAQEKSYVCTQQLADGSFVPLPANAIAQVMFGRRNVEGGDRQDNLTHTAFRLVVGAKGEINDTFSYDVYAQEGIALLSEEYLNDVSRTRLANALQVVPGPKGPVCLANANGANGAPGCVPYNVWGTGAVNPAAVTYFTVPGFQEGNVEQRIYSGNITADFTRQGVKMPAAHTGLILNVGAEYRAEYEALRPDSEFIGNGSLSDLAGQGSAVVPLSAGFHVWEGFAEARLPLLQDLPAARELSVEGGYRHSDYTLGFNTNTYKFGLDWAPLSDLRLRASYNRAVRVPSLQQLFAEKLVTVDGSTDPCATSGYGTPATATLAQCTSRAPPVGLTRPQYGTAGTPGDPGGGYYGLQGGNPNLKPEVADTYTFGMVITPTALPALNMTLDYFDIKINNVIANYGANLIADQCILESNPRFCSSVQQGENVGLHRDSAGSLWFSPLGYVEDPLLNLGYLWTRGVDVGARYRQELGRFGHMDLELLGTYTGSVIVEPYPGSGTFDCAGYFGATCGNPAPKWRHIFSDTWATPLQGFNVMARWRHFGSTKLDCTNASPLLNTCLSLVEPSFASTGSRDYLDLMFMYAWSKVTTVRLGVNNVLDKDPPILPTETQASFFFNGNTYPQVYDTLGRYVFVNITADF